MTEIMTSPRLCHDRFHGLSSTGKNIGIQDSLPDRQL